MDEINRLQSKAIKEISKNQRDLDENTLKLIATRLNSTKGLGLVDLFDLAYFAMVYSVMTQIATNVEKTRIKQIKSLEKLLDTAAKSAYASMKPLYGSKFLTFNQNKEVNDFAKSEIKSQSNDFIRQLKKIGYPLTDNKTGKIIFNSPSDAYQYISNEAKNQELSNPYGYESWGRGVLRQLLKSGLKIYNYNQDTHRYKQQNSYSYIRNFVKDAVYKVCQGIFNVVANQVGIDGIELSVHADSALDHLPIQGHQFTLAQFKRMQSNQDFYDIKGEHFDAIERAIGTWNCRHFVYPVKLGETKPRYTDEQLKEISDKTKSYTAITTLFGEEVPITYGEYARQLNNLQDKEDKFAVGVHVAEKFGNKQLIDYYKSKLIMTKQAIDTLKVRI